VATQEKILVPDIGDFEDVEVIEIMVSPGDRVAVEDPLITLESDKASMEIPSPWAGVIREITVAVGARVSRGSLIGTIEIEAVAAAAKAPAESGEAEVPAATGSAPPAREDLPEPAAPVADGKPAADAPGLPHPSEAVATTKLDFHAGPSVRKMARQLGIDLSKVKGSGRRGRITNADVEAYARKPQAGKEAKPDGIQIPGVPAVDFSKFGEIEIQAMKRIQKISARNLHRNWITIPHVTHFDEADVTDLESFRKKHNDTAREKSDRLTMMPFLFKAIVSGLKKFPTFNASLDPEGENLILKKYFHIGMAVDTPNGLLVPVIRDADRKSLQDLAREMGELTIKSRGGTVKREEMQGGCFTISNLGGIGGTGFTPIINAPEVAILGVPRASIKPVFLDNQFVPRLMLPLALSYDHRVVDGALAARFLAHVCELLTDIRKML